MPLTEKQREFLKNCSHRWNVKTGATGSGKSFVDYSVVIPKRIRAARGEGLLVLLGNTRGTLERNILEPMRELWPGLVGNIRSDNTVQIFGKKVYALGADNKKHVSRIQGATFEYVYGDEVTTWSEEVFHMLKSRLRCEHSHFDGTCNPEHPKHWFKKFLDGDADIYQQSYHIDDGCLPPHIVASLKNEYAGTIYYDRWIRGLWVSAEGLIYKYFANHTEEFLIDDPVRWLQERNKQIYKIVLGVDFGGTKSATAFKAVGITYDWCVLVLDEEHLDSEELDPDKLDRKFCEFVRRVQAVYGPSQTRADNAESVLIRGLQNAVRREKLSTAVLNAKKMEIKDRIRLTVLLMAQKRLFVARHCEHMTDAFQTAMYDPDSFEDVRLDDGTSDIDSLDAFEYCIEPYYQKLIRAREERFENLSGSFGLRRG